MRESVGARRRRIQAIVRSRGTVRVTTLAAELGVSMVTVRRDVEELARDGSLRRGHGVAHRVDGAPRQGGAERAVPPAADAVALVVPARHTYLDEVVRGARAALEAAGRRVTLHLAPTEPGAERTIVERVLADGTGGLLIAPRWRTAAAEAADAEWLSAVDVPMVLMERRPDGPLRARDSVSSDHWYGVHLAVNHLVGLGHRRVLLVSRDDSPTARSVRAAFEEIAAAHPRVAHGSVALRSPDAVSEPPAEASHGGAGTGFDLAAVLAERGATAAVLHGDVEALLLVQHLTGQGVRVPEDCSVISYDDVVAGLGDPPLTAVSPPTAEIGAAAAELLLRRLRHGDGRPAEPARRVELLPELTVRGSTRPPAR